MADIKKIAEVLQLASDAHEGVFHFTGGQDDDWATFYSDFMVNHTPLADMLGATPVRSHLTKALVELDSEYTAAAPSQPWPEYYAESLARQFGD